MKIANDLRWMNSGPLAGLAEIALPDLQPGSSIMPGKVNPVIPEAAAMVAAQVIGNDATITIAGQSGNFQLNVMLPVVALNLLQSIELLANVSSALADSAIKGFKVNKARLDEALERNPILVTALNPVIGYEKGAAIAKQAYKEGRAIREVAAEQTELASPSSCASCSIRSSSPRVESKVKRHLERHPPPTRGGAPAARSARAAAARTSRARCRRRCRRSSSARGGPRRCCSRCSSGRAGSTVLFTERAAHLKDHAGQISLPGGRLAPGETSAARRCARRTRRSGCARRPSSARLARSAS